MRLAPTRRGGFDASLAESRRRRSVKREKKPAEPISSAEREAPAPRPRA